MVQINIFKYRKEFQIYLKVSVEFGSNVVISVLFIYVGGGLLWYEKLF